jgi:dienelactone hydrolase
LQSPLVDSLRRRIAEFVGLAPIPEPLLTQVVERCEHESYTRSLLRYSAPDGDQIEAFLLEPSGRASTGGVLVIHQHNSQWAIGKSEVAGLAGDPLQALGPALARRGMTVLAPDTIGFESRLTTAHGDTSLAPPLTKPGSSPDGWLQYYNQMAHRACHGDLLIRKMLLDCAAATSVLRIVSPNGTPIGAIGHSMGGGVALFLGALDTRIDFTCMSGAVCSYRHKRAHDIGLEMALVIPGFATRFDVADLLRCIAPRAVLVVSAEDDPASGDASDVVGEARSAFKALEASERLTHLHASGGHALDPQRFGAIVEWAALQVKRAG